MNSMSGPGNRNSPLTRDQTKIEEIVPALTTLLQIDEVVVPGDLYDAARNGSDAAIEALSFKVNGVILYRHAFPFEPGGKVVTIRDLAALGIVGSVVLRAEA